MKKSSLIIILVIITENVALFGLIMDGFVRFCDTFVQILMIFSRKSRDFSHGMDRLTQRPFGRFFFGSALYFGLLI